MISPESYDNCFWDGYSAAENGRSLDENPHKGERFIAWNAGHYQYGIERMNQEIREGLHG